MTELHTDAAVCFISPNVARGGDGTVHRPFPNLRAALDHLHSREAHVPSFEIACVEAPGVLGGRQRKPRFRFYIDEHRHADTPDGTESAPWIDRAAAVNGLMAMDDRGALALRPGDRLAVVYHEVFTSTSLDLIKARKERIAKYVFMVAAFLLVIPVVAILGYLTFEAIPALSIEFLIENPTDMGKAGGIWAPLIGTFLLVFVSLLISAPIGILAGVYLNEYAPDNWFTRIVSLAVVNLAGVPSIVHGLFGFGAFVLFAGIGKSVLAASCTLAVMTLPVVITSTARSFAPYRCRSAKHVGTWGLAAGKRFGRSCCLTQSAGFSPA